MENKVSIFRGFIECVGAGFCIMVLFCALMKVLSAWYSFPSGSIITWIMSGILGSSVYYFVEDQVLDSSLSVHSFGCTILFYSGCFFL